MQGSAFTGRIAQSARYLTIVGLGPKDKAKVQAEWGVSPYQVGIRHLSLPGGHASLPLAPKMGSSCLLVGMSVTCQIGSRLLKTCHCLLGSPKQQRYPCCRKHDRFLLPAHFLQYASGSMLQQHMAQ